MLRRSLIAAFPLAAVGGAAAQDKTTADKTATAIFAGGCFCCVEADFDKVAWLSSLQQTRCPSIVQVVVFIA